jgi:prepilin-type N-terminal cleavage/methylation domain-containing protein
MKGFSLVEIMVVVAIMAIMASGVVIGFGSFEKTVRVRETAGVITDTIKNLELEMVRRDYVKQTVHFKKNYLVSEAEPENKALSLTYVGASPSCAADEERLTAENSTGLSPIYLAQRDALGNNLKIDVIPASTNKSVCVKFLNSKETEWDYQLFKGSDVSQTVRFIHFNIRRGEDVSQLATITSGNNYKLQISAPYADKEFYNGVTLEAGEVKLTVENSDGQKEDIILQS